MTGLERRFRRGMAVELDGAPAKIVKVSSGGRWVHVSSASGVAANLNEAEARGRIRVPGEDPELLLTPKQADLLARVRETRGMFLRGTAEVRNARRVEVLGLVSISDDGRARDRSDRERWWCAPVDQQARKARTT